jgi:hypothetical protein
VFNKYFPSFKINERSSYWGRQASNILPILVFLKVAPDAKTKGIKEARPRAGHIGFNFFFRAGAERWC